MYYILLEVNSIGGTNTSVFNPDWCLNNKKVVDPTWKVKDINSAIMTKSEDEPIINSAVASKDLQEKAKCKWYVNQGYKVRGCNIRLKKIEDTKEEIKNQANN